MGSCFSTTIKPTEPQQVTKYRHPKKKSIRESVKPK